MSAPLEAGGWDNALKKMAHHTGSARGQLIAIGGARVFPFNWITDANPESTDEFVAIGGGDPAINWRVACAGAPFKIASEADYKRARAAMQFDVYNDWAERYEMPNGCQTVLLREGGTLFGLAALRTRADGETTEAQRAAFAEIAPFALAATRMQHALEHQGAALVAGALEAMNAAAFVCDGRGRVGALTAAAEDILHCGEGLRLTDNRLYGRRSTEDRALQSALARALVSAGVTGVIDRIWLQGDGGLMTGHLCEVFALPRREWSFGFEARILVVLRRPSELGGANRALIGQLLELTSAETDIAMLAAEGLSREEMALRRGTSFETVNVQMKSLFRKADVHREAELVALLNKLMR